MIGITVEIDFRRRENKRIQKKKPYVLFGVIVIILIVIGVFAYTTFFKNSSGPFVGSVNSDVYHYPSCQYAKRIKSANIIWFDNATDARNHGYRPCKVCNPP